LTLSTNFRRKEASIDVSTAFDDFCAIVKWHLEQYVPTRTDLVRHKDPALITLAIKIT